MRTTMTVSWLLRGIALAIFFVGTSAWAQDSGSSVPAAYGGEPQVAQPAQQGVNWKEVGIGAGTAVTNLLYFPVKLTYGVLGGIAGGAGYALTGGNKQVADTIWRSSLGGDYVLTPDMMTGKKPIYFSGASEDRTTQAANSGSSSLPANSTSTASGASLSVPSAAPDTVHSTHQIDAGAGPVSSATVPRTPYAGASNVSNGYRNYTRPETLRRSALGDTSVE
jgi:hypothetical protein